MRSTAVIIAALLQLNGAFSWQNNFDGPLDFECGDNSFISGVRSVHDNHHEDREWEYSCTRLATTAKLGHCEWFLDQNKWDDLLAFRCRTGVITGVKSRHDNHYEDRVFGFKCCNVESLTLHDCSITTELNQYDQPMNYRAPHGYCIVGFDSQNSNAHEDRVWKAEICQLS